VFTPDKVYGIVVYNEEYRKTPPYKNLVDVNKDKEKIEETFKLLRIPEK
jgi:hypothetical protein